MPRNVDTTETTMTKAVERGRRMSPPAYGLRMSRTLDVNPPSPAEQWRRACVFRARRLSPPSLTRLRDRRVGLEPVVKTLPSPGWLRASSAASLVAFIPSGMRAPRLLAAEAARSAWLGPGLDHWLLAAAYTPKRVKPTATMATKPPPSASAKSRRMRCAQLVSDGYSQSSPPASSQNTPGSSLQGSMWGDSARSFSVSAATVVAISDGSTAPARSDEHSACADA